jgi:hypothetical protein
VQIGSSDGIEPGDVGEAALRALDDCCLSEIDSGKTLLVGVGERGISRRVVKGGKENSYTNTNQSTKIITLFT